MAYNLHDLRITGIELAEVLSCRIEGKIGEHSSLTIYGYLAEQESVLYEIPNYQAVEVYLEIEKEPKILFSGVVTNLSYTVAAELKLIKIEGKSNSFLMDLAKRSRSFQDVKMSYMTLVSQVMNDYPGSSLSYAAAELPIGKLIVQYEETDWQFLKRVLSMMGLTVTPDSQKAGIKLHAGIPALFEKEITYQLLEIEKDMNAFYSLQANGYQVYDAAFTRYKIASEHMLELFEQVNFSGHLFTVYSYQYDFKVQEMVGIYGVQMAQGLLILPIYPMHLIGVALTGKVVNISGDKVLIALSIDQDSGNPAVYWFTYSTISASPNGSGWYCMPELGDDVRVYFPSKHENETIALSSASKYGAPGGGKTDRMQDPNTRYLRTKDGQELALAPGFLKLSCGEGLSSVVIKEDGKISVSALNQLVVEGLTGVTIHAEEKLSVHSQDAIEIQSLSGGNVQIGGGNIGFFGTEVKFE